MLQSVSEDLYTFTCRKFFKIFRIAYCVMDVGCIFRFRIISSIRVKPLLPSNDTLRDRPGRPLAGAPRSVCFVRYVTTFYINIPYMSLKLPVDLEERAVGLLAAASSAASSVAGESTSVGPHQYLYSSVCQDRSGTGRYTLAYDL